MHGEIIDLTTPHWRIKIMLIQRRILDGDGLYIGSQIYLRAISADHDGVMVSLKIGLAPSEKEETICKIPKGFGLWINEDGKINFRRKGKIDFVETRFSELIVKDNCNTFTIQVERVGPFFVDFGIRAPGSIPIYGEEWMNKGGSKNHFPYNPVRKKKKLKQYV